MGKYTIQHLADILVKKNGLADNEAQNFVNGIFEVIKEGLETDKLVKIKGFGTFKIIDVDPRESVNGRDCTGNTRRFITREHMS